MCNGSKAKAVLFVILSVYANAAWSATKDDMDAYFRMLNEIAQKCVLEGFKASSGADTERLYDKVNGVLPEADAKKLGDRYEDFFHCKETAKASATDAYKAYLKKEPNANLALDAKKVLSAWINYLNSMQPTSDIGGNEKGLEYEQLRQAESDMEVDAL